MIAHDQPTIFGQAIIAAVSSKEDGNLKFGLDNDEKTLANRRAFLQKAGIDIAHTTLVGITYDTDDFAKYRIAVVDDKSAGMMKPSHLPYVDALVVDQPGHALFLPLADCVGAILYDPEQKVLMVSHLGRHSVEQNGGAKSVDYLKQHFRANAEQLLVWLSPAVGKATYPLRAFEGKSLHEVIVGQLEQAGVQREHIEVSAIDTAVDENYYSHSEHLKGNEGNFGRFAIVAQMRTQGEPAV